MLCKAHSPQLLYFLNLKGQEHQGTLEDRAIIVHHWKRWLSYTFPPQSFGSTVPMGPPAAQTPQGEPNVDCIISVEA